MNTKFFNIKWASRRLRYLLLNPKYFYLYFYGKPEKVFSALTDVPESQYYKLKQELDRDADFTKDLREKTLKFMNVDFSLNMDHYFLYSLVRTIKPSVILETGVFHGYYTACYLKGLYDNYRYGSVDGKLISIDLPAYESISESPTESPHMTHLPSGNGPGWVIPDNLRDRWELHIGDSRELLPEVLDREKNISLFFHDSLHTYDHMMYEFENVYPVLNNGAYLMTHDVHWNHSFRHFVKRHGQKDFSFHGFGVFRKQTNNQQR